MLNKIKVYGRLARFLGERTFEAEVKTPIDTFKFLLANFPHLERHMMEQNYLVKVGKELLGSLANRRFGMNNVMNKIVNIFFIFLLRPLKIILSHFQQLDHSPNIFQNI